MIARAASRDRRAPCGGHVHGCRRRRAALRGEPRSAPRPDHGRPGRRGARTKRPGYNLIVFAGFAATAEAQEYLAPGQARADQRRAARGQRRPALGDLLKNTKASARPSGCSPRPRRRVHDGTDGDGLGRAAGHGQLRRGDRGGASRATRTRSPRGFSTTTTTASSSMSTRRSSRDRTPGRRWQGAARARSMRRSIESTALVRVAAVRAGPTRKAAPFASSTTPARPAKRSSTSSAERRWRSRQRRARSGRSPTRTRSSTTRSRSRRATGISARVRRRSRDGRRVAGYIPPMLKGGQLQITDELVRPGPGQPDPRPGAGVARGRLPGGDAGHQGALRALVRP